MQARRCFLSLLIADACRSYPLVRSLRSAPAGLSKMEPSAGAVLSFACAPGHTAADGAIARNGVFTKHLLQHLATPALDVDVMLRRGGRDGRGAAAVHEPPPARRQSLPVLSVRDCRLRTLIQRLARCNCARIYSPDEISRTRAASYRRYQHTKSRSSTFERRRPSRGFGSVCGLRATLVEPRVGSSEPRTGTGARRAAKACSGACADVRVARPGACVWLRCVYPLRGGSSAAPRRYAPSDGGQLGLGN